MTKKYYYVYRITNILIKKHYYGFRSCNVEPKLDIGYVYFSSSTDKEFIKDQKLNRCNYKYKVISIFNNRIDALKLEIYLHKKFNVRDNDSFYNKANQTSTSCIASPESNEKRMLLIKSSVWRETVLKKTN